MLRNFDRPADLRLLLELLENWKRSDPSGDYEHVGDILWALREPNLDPNSNITFLENDGRAEGFCFVESGFITFRTLPGLPVESDEELLRWGEQVVLSRSSGKGDGASCMTQARDGNMPRLSMLSRLGYKADGNYFIILERPTDDNSANARLPEGFSFVDGPDEERIDDYVRMHREAWGAGSTYTAEVHRHMMQNPGYEGFLNPTVVSPEGEIAASCIIWLDRSNRVGEIEPLQVSPSFRRLGLARITVFEAVRRMYSRGMERALVYNAAVNKAAGRLYATCGFSPSGKVLVLKKRAV